MSLHFYLRDGDRVLLVDDAPLPLDRECELVVDHCYLTDVLYVGKIYDMIVFPKTPPEGILRKMIEKVCWGGYVVMAGVEKVVEEYQVVSGNPRRLVLRRPLERFKK